MNDFAISVLTAPLRKNCLFSLGQAGYILKSRSGQILGIDLYLSDCVERMEGDMGFKRLLPAILGPRELEFDCIITTHPHLDHFDVHAVPELMSMRKTRLFASENCEKLIKMLYMDASRVTYVKPGDSIQAGDFGLDFVTCDHGTSAPDAVGVVVSVDGKRVYEAGDTALRLDRIDELKNFGPLDVMIAPINGAYGNMNEEDCARLIGALKPRLTIPCHYGMFAAHGGNPGKFMSIMREQYPDSPFLLMAQGERYIIE